MTIRNQELGCTGVNCIGSLGYNAPAGTTDNFEFFLRPPQELFWQDGHKVTAWDVAFSFASLQANGAFLGTGVSSDTCNTVNCADSVDVLHPGELDVHVTNRGPFTQLGLMTTLILPGHFWSTCASTWDSLVASASASTNPRTAFSASCMSADPGKLGFTYDPINNGIMLGTGPWECVTEGPPIPGNAFGGCTSTGLANPPPGGTYTLTRNGFGSPAGSDPSKEYFRSNANLALYLWTGFLGSPIQDPINFGDFAACVGVPAPAPPSSPCLHWQEGFGTPGGPSVIDGIQIGIMKRFPFINPVSPFNFPTNLPAGLASFNPVVHQGSTTFTPSNGNSALCPAAYDC